MAVLKNCPLVWASITVPNTTYEPVYSVNVIVDDETASDFENRGFKVKQMEEGKEGPGKWTNQLPRNSIGNTSAPQHL